MYPYHVHLTRRIEKLTDIVEEKTAALRDAPPETLRVSGSANRNHVQYYLYDSEKNKNGTYISVKETSLVKRLAQKAYDTKVLRSAQKELRILLRLQKHNSEPCAEEIYQNLSPNRQLLVTPIELPEEEFVRQWKSQKYMPKAFAENTPEHYTSRGERVRSKSEVLIADTLTEMGIPYLYEKPLSLGDRVIHPDFTLLHVQTRRTLFLEHFGMMDDPDYADSAVARIYLYARHNIVSGEQLLLTFESKNNPLNTRLLRAQLRRMSDFT